MDFDFKGKTALVTGATGSIGKAVAAGFLKGGAQVFITDLREEDVKKTCDELGKGCQGLAGNVAVEAEAKKVCAAAAKALGGRVDYLVNVAGVVGQGKIEEITEDEWDRIFDVNCKGSFFFIREIAPLMKKHLYGRIINYSSKSGKTGSALMVPYSAAKAAVIGMTQALAYELADFGINVNCVCPGITENTGVWSNVSSGYVQNLNLPMDEVVKKFSAKVPLKRLAKVDEVANVTLFLASEGADYMTGQAINITGGREMH